jgi:hypothetical protein
MPRRRLVVAVARSDRNERRLACAAVAATTAVVRSASACLAPAAFCTSGQVAPAVVALLRRRSASAMRWEPLSVRRTVERAGFAVGMTGPFYLS